MAMIEPYHLLRGGCAFPHHLSSTHRSLAASAATTIADDDFPMSYDSGLTLFIVLTCVSSMVFVIGWFVFYWLKLSDDDASLQGLEDDCCTSFMDRQPGDWCCDCFILVCPIALAAGVIMLVWGSAKFTLEKRVEEPPYSYHNMIGGATVFLVFTLVLSAAPFFIIASNPNRALFLVSLVFLLIPGLVLLAAYCNRMRDIGAFEYNGPMRINGFQIDKAFADAENHDGKWRAYSKLDVSWGELWGCPANPDTWCTSLATERDCRYCEKGATDEYCIDGSEEVLLEDAADCMIEKYNVLHWSETIDVSNDGWVWTFGPGYDHDMPPIEDEGWPFAAILYGDCSSCDAVFEYELLDTFESAQNLKPVGTGMSLAGGIVSVLSLLSFLLNCIRQRSRQNGRSIHAEEATQSEIPVRVACLDDLISEATKSAREAAAESESLKRQLEGTENINKRSRKAEKEMAGEVKLHQPRAVADASTRLTRRSSDATQRHWVPLEASSMPQNREEKNIKKIYGYLFRAKEGTQSGIPMHVACSNEASMPRNREEEEIMEACLKCEVPYEPPPYNESEVQRRLRRDQMRKMRKRARKQLMEGHT